MLWHFDNVPLEIKMNFLLNALDIVDIYMPLTYKIILSKISYTFINRYLDQNIDYYNLLRQ